MARVDLVALLGLIYDLERSRSFRQLRRELERYYRRQNSQSHRRDAYIDSMLTLLYENDQAALPLLARQ
ncbi:MAG: hypothetical protein GX060_06760 [Firmicutes bacterium]|nr:hypothetical protein [Bacillota bacterium]